MMHLVVETFLVMFVASVLVLALHYRAMAKQALYRPSHRDDVPPPAPAVVVSPPPQPQPGPTRPPEEVVRLTFLSERGRTVGHAQVAKRFRRPTMQYRSRDGKLGNFVAIAPDTYQRVGVDREH